MYTASYSRDKDGITIYLDEKNSDGFGSYWRKTYLTTITSIKKLNISIRGLRIRLYENNPEEYTEFNAEELTEYNHRTLEFPKELQSIPGIRFPKYIRSIL